MRVATNVVLPKIIFEQNLIGLLKRHVICGIGGSIFFAFERYAVMYFLSMCMALIELSSTLQQLIS